MSATGTSSASNEDEPDEKPAKKPDRFTKMEEAFVEQFTATGTNLMLFGAQADGLVIINRADPLAKKLVAVARQNPAVYRALKKYLDGSAYAMLIEEFGVIGLSICLNHGINPVEWVQGLFKKLFKKPEAEGGNAGNDQLPNVA